jgi:hypothetical protein
VTQAHRAVMLKGELERKAKVKAKKRIKIEKENIIVQVMKVMIRNCWRIQGFQNQLIKKKARKRKIKKRKNLNHLAVIQATVIKVQELLVYLLKI